jgi:hypothetical protein
VENLLELDKWVGHVAGSIYGDLSLQFPYPPLMLIPMLTFKVKRILEPLQAPDQMTSARVGELAANLRNSIIPMLHSLELEPSDIERMAPIIETAASRALSGRGGFHHAVE